MPNQMNNVIKKYKLTINIIAYLLIIGVVSFLVIRPVLRSIKENNDNIQKSVLDQEDKEKRIAEIPELEKEYEDVEKQSGRISYFFTEDKAVELIEDIEAMAEATGNTVGIEVLDKKENKAIRGSNDKGVKEEKADIMADLPMSDFVHLKINLGGSFEGLVNFIEKLEAMKYYSDVVSLKSANEIKTKVVENASTDKNAAPADTTVKTVDEYVLNTSVEVVFYVKK
jgi:hypothetical protein